MNELQRQAYLEAMGVDCYSPRLQLPGALPSPLCAMPAGAAQSAGAVAANALVATPWQAGQGRAAAMQALLGDKLLGDKLLDDKLLDGKPPANQPANTGKELVNAGTVDTAAELIAAGSASRQSVPRFSLSITRANRLLLIDDGLPGHINPAEYLQLLENIVFAVGAGKQQLSIDAFVWPMSRSSQFDQSETAARQMLEAFIAKQINHLNTRYILVMGDTAAQYLSQQPLPLGELVPHPHLAVQLLRTRSACPLLSDAALKPEVWRDLQPLYRLLNRP